MSLVYPCSWGGTGLSEDFVHFSPSVWWLFLCAYTSEKMSLQLLPFLQRCTAIACYSVVWWWKMGILCCPYMISVPLSLAWGFTNDSTCLSGRRPLIIWVPRGFLTPSVVGGCFPSPCPRHKRSTIVPWSDPGFCLSHTLGSSSIEKDLDTVSGFSYGDGTLLPSSALWGRLSLDFLSVYDFSHGACWRSFDWL